MLYCTLNFLGLPSILFRLNIYITKIKPLIYFSNFLQPSSLTLPEPIIHNYKLSSMSATFPSNFAIFDFSIFYIHFSFVLSLSSSSPTPSIVFLFILPMFRSSCPIVLICSFFGFDYGIQFCKEILFFFLLLLLFVLLLQDLQNICAYMPFLIV